MPKLKEKVKEAVSEKMTYYTWVAQTLDFQQPLPSQRVNFQKCTFCLYLPTARIVGMQHLPSSFSCQQQRSVHLLSIKSPGRVGRRTLLFILASLVISHCIPSFTVANGIFCLILLNTGSHTLNLSKFKFSLFQMFNI